MCSTVSWRLEADSKWFLSLCTVVLRWSLLWTLQFTDEAGRPLPLQLWVCRVASSLASSSDAEDLNSGSHFVWEALLTEPSTSQPQKIYFELQCLHGNIITIMMMMIIIIYNKIIMCNYYYYYYTIKTCSISKCKKANLCFHSRILQISRGKQLSSPESNVSNKRLN